MLGESMSVRTALDDSAVTALRTRVRGQVLRPEDSGYDAARRIWNGMIDRQPALILRCAGVADVIQAVDFAREHQSRASVKGGGHNVAGNAVCDGGVMIDLSRMKGIRIDPIRCLARAEPGLTWGEFDHETQALGLAVTGGIQSTTGIAGLTLGGGFGYLARKHGLTCDNLLSADVVTAEGERVTASAAENADLFWGLRGGGGNFGIVTSFEFRLHPLGPVLGGRLVYPLAQAREVLQFFRERSKDEPEEMFSIASFATAPVIQSIPEELRGKTVLVLIICYAGATEEGERHLKPLRTFLPAAVDTIGMTPYTSMQTLLDAANPPHWNNYWKAEFLDDLPDRAIDLLIDFATRAPSPMSKVLIPHLGGAISRVPLHDTAYVHRGAPFIVNINAMWANSEDSERNIAWAKDYWAALQPFSLGGAYVNFLSNEGEERVKAAYGAETYRRLVELKNKHDPANFFRLNQNIRPTV